MSEGSPYTVTLEARDSHHSVTAELHDKPPTPTEGGGGWEEVALPRRGAVIVWKGRTLLKLNFAIVFSGLDDEHAIGPAHLTLRHMYRPPDPHNEPPVLQVSSSGDVVPYLDEGLQWVLSSLEWGDAVADADGHRVMQVFDVGLTEYRPDERLTTAAAAHPQVTRYRIERKDIAQGLGGIAERLHVKGGWKALAEWQTPERTEPRLTSKDIGKWLLVPIPGKVLVGPGHPKPTVRR